MSVMDDVFLPLKFQRRGVQKKASDHRQAHDATLVEGMARAFYWQHLLDTGAMQSSAAIARAEKLHHSVVNELLRLTLLTPDIIEQFMAGRQPRRLTLMWFQRNRLMVDWYVCMRAAENRERKTAERAPGNTPSGGRAQETKAGNRANTGGTGKKNQPRTVDFFWIAEAIPNMNHRPSLVENRPQAPKFKPLREPGDQRQPACDLGLHPRRDARSPLAVGWETGPRAPACRPCFPRSGAG